MWWQVFASMHVLLFLSFLSVTFLSQNFPASGAESQTLKRLSSADRLLAEIAEAMGPKHPPSCSC